MGNELWLDKEFDLLEGLHLQEYQKMVTYAKDNQQLVMSSWYNRDHTVFEKTLRLGSSILRFFERHLKKDSRGYCQVNVGKFFHTETDSLFVLSLFLVSCHSI